MTEQKELPCPLFTERGFHDWRWVGWPLGSIIPVTVEERWCNECGLRQVPMSGKWDDAGFVTQAQPAEDERVKEARARDLAQEIVIESSKAAGYADSTWLDGVFKHELTDRITAALSLLPVQPARLFEAKLLGFDDYDRIRLCEPCLKRAIDDSLVISSSALPVQPAASTPTEAEKIEQARDWEMKNCTCENYWHNPQEHNVGCPVAEAASNTEAQDDE